VSVVLYGDPWSDEVFEEQDVGIWSSADPEILHASRASRTTSATA
jgi:hypothetical protein